MNEEHPDTPLLEHAKELISKLSEFGIQPSPEDDDGPDQEWEDVEGSDDEDEEMDVA